MNLKVIKGTVYDGINLYQMGDIMINVDDETFERLCTEKVAEPFMVPIDKEPEKPDEPDEPDKTDENKNTSKEEFDPMTSDIKLVKELCVDMGINVVAKTNDNVRQLLAEALLNAQENQGNDELKTGMPE